MDRPTLIRAWRGKLLSGLGWRLRALIGDSRLDRWICRIALGWRTALNKTSFIAVGGSAGKTTTKNLLLAVLAQDNFVIGTRLSLNATPEVAKVVLRTRAWHRFCVVELGESGPGTLDPMLELIHPAMAVVTNIGDDHLSEFGTREAAASEIVKIVRALALSGLAILNADDPLVDAMANECSGKVIRFGRSPHADVRAEVVEASLDAPLRFLVSYQGQECWVSTRLCGEQMLAPALAAIAVGLACGTNLKTCADLLEGVPPTDGRMQLLEIGGATYLRDDFKAPLWTIYPLLEQLRNLRGRRKIFVIGTLSDCTHKQSMYRQLAREALKAADEVIIVGKMGDAALSEVHSTEASGRLKIFHSVHDVHSVLKSSLHRGDFVVIKGTNKVDHLVRLTLAAEREILCWRDDCGRDMFCDQCSHLDKAASLPAKYSVMLGGPEIETLPRLGADDIVIIGIGNPEEKFRLTPHNVGQLVLDRFLEDHRGLWQEYARTSLAPLRPERVGTSKNTVWLMKLKCPVNLSGAILSDLAAKMGFAAEQCILVFDDLAIPLGTVKVKLNGSSGGHRGVASILEAFQSDRFRRVKIGIAPAEKKVDTRAYVLQPFTKEAMELLNPAIDLAVRRLTQLTRFR